MTILNVACSVFVSIALASGAAMAAPYQQYKVGACGSSSTCTITFVAVPAGKTAELNNVSCYVSMTAGAGIKKLQLQQVLANSAVAVSVTLAPAPFLIAFGTSAQADLEMVNTPVTLYATGGQKFRVRANLVSGTFKEFFCHVSGKI
jgi:catabolite regulation protein CreA